MNHCYFCKTELLGNNISKEHILPNAIGGRLTSNQLMCRDCNSKYGDSIDAEFCNQFLSLSSMLQIKKQRGEIVTLKNLSTKSGEKYNIVDGYKPVLAHPTVELNN